MVLLQGRNAFSGVVEAIGHHQEDLDPLRGSAVNRFDGTHGTRDGELSHPVPFLGDCVI